MLRDIAVRHGVRNTHTLMELTLFLFTETGKETTYNSLRKAFDIGGRVLFPSTSPGSGMPG